jgi:hypothetical protein
MPIPRMDNVGIVFDGLDVGAREANAQRPDLPHSACSAGQA